MTPMFSNLGVERQRFYHFLISNSLLIGLFPFFIPVFLWRSGFSLAGIAFYISMTGLSFCLGIWIWDRIKVKLGWRRMVILAFALEILLLLSVLGDENDSFIFIFAFLTGLYNCAYWMTQRTLFIGSIHPGNSGNAYGNLQIVVLLALKLAMLTGGFLLEQKGFLSILIVSTIIAISACISIYLLKIDFSKSIEAGDFQPVSLKTSLQFKDEFGARKMFWVDGIFLYLESHFWLLSLYFIADENYTMLSLIVIVLGVSFSLIFFLLKRTIDKQTSAYIYQVTLYGYILSWVLRALLPQMSQSIMVVSLIAIAFLTALFRLTFNKRFFDHALISDKHQYIVAKGYLSQIGLAVWYLLAGCALLLWEQSAANQLCALYLAVLPLMIVYWKYQPRPAAQNS